MNIFQVASDASSLNSIGSTPSYDGSSDSSAFSTASSFTPTPSSRSRLDSFLSTASSSGKSPRRMSRHRYSSGSRSNSSCRSGTSSNSKSSRKSILKKSRNTSSGRERSVSKKRSKSPNKNMLPVGEFAKIKNPAILRQVRGFISDYSTDPEFEAFSLNVDGIPFVALSLMNSDSTLLGRFKNVQPPTPMKKHTPGLNSPRKRLEPYSSRSSSAHSKCVRFTDEGSSPKKAKRSLSGENEESFRELVETVSDAMIENGRQYNDLWKDRTNSVEK
ncbi:hypothetical protein CRE_27484 [Caenorhabditis remanei]|uniref:Uncharacterized protein n=1 Tax=Caenorhabditis remanei TaxID=31234 RepID=E3LNV2_CAERE|nr:hypothetical protein CRE_27484 [Caenorhabditis remanei]